MYRGQSRLITPQSTLAHDRTKQASGWSCPSFAQHLAEPSADDRPAVSQCQMFGSWHEDRSGRSTPSLLQAGWYAGRDGRKCSGSYESWLRQGLPSLLSHSRLISRAFSQCYAPPTQQCNTRLRWQKCFCWPNPAGGDTPSALASAVSSVGCNEAG